MPLVYTSSERSLAVLEMLVHMDPRFAHPGFSLIPAEVPDAEIVHLPENELPEGWDSIPALDETRVLGNAWAKNRESLALAVPSAVLPQGIHILINPWYPSFGTVSIGAPEPFVFDPRLVRQ